MFIEIPKVFLMAGKHSFQPLETFLYPVLSPLECASQVHGVFINIDLLFTFGGQPKAVTYILGISWATLIQLQRASHACC